MQSTYAKCVKAGRSAVMTLCFIRMVCKIRHSQFTLFVVLIPTKVCPRGTGRKRPSKKNRPMYGFTCRNDATSK